jgi:putative transposase
LNPQRAGLCNTAESWLWSGARAHLGEFDDDLVSVSPMLQRVVDWKSYLNESTKQSNDELLHYQQRTGKHLGSLSFIEKLKTLCRRILRPLKSGPKMKVVG